MKDKIQVVVKFFPILGCYSLCHAKSHQSAFRSAVNKFSTPQDAVRYAVAHGCEVVHSGDAEINYNVLIVHS